jgi:hypothetical protein
MATLNSAILDTVLGHLALLFVAGAKDDISKARHAAGQTIAAYNPETLEQFTLASQIIGFSFHALKALAQAVAPELSLTRTLRLRGSAVSLSREAHKAQRKLDQLQRARPQRAQPQPAEALLEPASLHPDPQAGTEPETGAEPRQPMVAQSAGGTWSRSYQKRQLAQRMTENLKRNQQQRAAQPAHLNGAPQAAAAEMLACAR